MKSERKIINKKKLGIAPNREQKPKLGPQLSTAVRKCCHNINLGTC